MTDLIKRDDALAAIDTFKRDFEQSWKVQFSADIAALPAIDHAAIPALQARIEELEKQCSFYARSDQFLVEEIKELEAKLTKAVEYFKKLDRRGDTLEFFDPVVHEIVTAALADLGGR